jgi:GTP-binding protein YchF
MKIGLIGMSKSGKTTVFNSLTGLQIDVSEFGVSSGEPNHGVVEVMDSRITTLSESYQPKKTIYATIEYLDFPGLEEGAGSSVLIKGTMGGLVKSSDALALIVRNFNDEIVSSMHGKPNPVNEVNALDSELIINDLILIEKRIEKIELGYKKGIKDNIVQFEEKTLRKMADHLNEEKPLRTLELSEDEQKAIRGFQFLSLKPLMVIINSDEDSYGTNDDVISQLSTQFKVIEFAGKFESELEGLDEEDALMFMQDMGITESARDRLTKESYDLLGYISFFTVGTDEVRAWTVEKSANAVEAAGKIHSDLARGFIRAECFNYQNWKELGSEKAVKEKGLFRLEGKNYLVQDGDILNIRFNV